jgi:hypothetical protein
MMFLGVKDVRHTGFKLAAHNYGNVRDVSHLSKNSEGIQIRAIRK